MRKKYELVRRHVEIGASILQPLTHLGRVVEYVRYHHERLNGSGYLEGLKGDDIPLGAQIVDADGGLYNALSRSDLRMDQIEKAGDTPRAKTQFERTLQSAIGAPRVNVYLSGEPLDEALSAAG